MYLELSRDIPTLESAPNHQGIEWQVLRMLQPQVLVPKVFPELVNLTTFASLL